MEPTTTKIFIAGVSTFSLQLFGVGHIALFWGVLGAMFAVLFLKEERNGIKGFAQIVLATFFGAGGGTLVGKVVPMAMSDGALMIGAFVFSAYIQSVLKIGIDTLASWMTKRGQS